MSRSFTSASTDFLGNATASVTVVPLTIACWWNASGTLGARGLFGIYDSGGTHSFSIRSTATGAVLFRMQSAANQSITTSTTTTSGTWNHSCGVAIAANSRAVYLNGGGKSTGATSGTPAGLNSTEIGRLGGASPSSYFDGLIAEAAIWDAALTDAEVLILATGASPFTVRPVNLVSYWPLWGRYSPETDIVGNFDLTVNGAVYADHSRVIMSRGRKIFLPTAGGSTLNITPSGSVSASGSLRLTINKSFAGSITETGAIAKSIQKPLGDSLTPSGSIVKSCNKVLAGSITPSGVLTKVSNKVLSGIITLSGVVTKSTPKSLSGSITPSGNVIPSLTKSLSGSITPSGSITKSISHILAGSISPSGTLTHTTNKSLDGSISLSGEVIQARLLNLSGVITSSGELTRQITKDLQGSISPIGVVTRSVTKILNGEIILGGVLDILFVSAPDIIIGIITVSPLMTGQVSCSPVMEGALTTLPSITGVVKFNPKLP